MHAAHLHFCNLNVFHIFLSNFSCGILKPESCQTDKTCADHLCQTKISRIVCGWNHQYWRQAYRRTQEENWIWILVVSSVDPLSGFFANQKENSFEESLSLPSDWLVNRIFERSSTCFASWYELSLLAERERPMFGLFVADIFKYQWMQLSVFSLQETFRIC